MVKEPAHLKCLNIKKRYTHLERSIYALKRYCIFLVILIPCFLYLKYVNPDENVLMTLLVTRIARSTVGVMLACLFMKFAFPKIAFQTEILDEANISVAIIFAAIVIAVCM